MCAGSALGTRILAQLPHSPFTYATNNLPKIRDLFAVQNRCFQLTKHGGNEGRRKNSHELFGVTVNQNEAQGFTQGNEIATLGGQHWSWFLFQLFWGHSVLEKRGISGFWAQRRLVLKWATRPITITLWLRSRACDVSGASGAALVQLIRTRSGEQSAATIFPDTLRESLQDVKKIK